LSPSTICWEVLSKGVDRGLKLAPVTVSASSRRAMPSSPNQRGPVCARTLRRRYCSLVLTTALAQLHDGHVGERECGGTGQRAIRRRQRPRGVRTACAGLPVLD